MKRLLPLLLLLTAPACQSHPRLLLSTTDLYAFKLPATNPARVYRPLPIPDGMALLASLPARDTAIAGVKLDLQVEPPPAGDRPVLIYDRLPDGRYAATQVRYQGRDWPLAALADKARRQPPERGEFVHFAPTWREWRSLLESGGLSVIGASPAPFDAALEQKARSAGKAGVVCRARPGGLAAVEVRAGDAWIPFETFLTDRRRLADQLAPAVAGLRIGDWLREFGRGATWHFRPGMAYGDAFEWWGAHRPRLTRHEGIDLRFLGRRELEPGEAVPAAADGEVVAVFDDFIARTLVVRHTQIRGGALYTVYAHVKPAADRDAPYPIRRFETLARVAASATTAPSHVHFSVLFAPDWLPAARLDWDAINANFTPVVLLDPRSRRAH